MAIYIVWFHYENYVFTSYNNIKGRTYYAMKKKPYPLSQTIVIGIAECSRKMNEGDQVLHLFGDLQHA